MVVPFSVLFLAGCVDYRPLSSLDMESLQAVRTKKEDYCEKVEHYTRGSTSFLTCVDEQMKLEDEYRARQRKLIAEERARVERERKIRDRTPLDALSYGDFQAVLKAKKDLCQWTYYLKPNTPSFNSCLRRELRAEDIRRWRLRQEDRINNRDYPNWYDGGYPGGRYPYDGGGYPYDGRGYPYDELYYNKFLTSTKSSGS